MAFIGGFYEKNNICINYSHIFWIDDVLSYYYSIEDNVEAATDEAGIIEVNYDFASDKPVPSDLKSLKEIKAMW